ncbi:MAG: UDP-glucose 4-epimerase GalE [Tenericutes bacterium]|nr:UDP-glucose 4-epimerase GalE [Mycoplasmatota bacterium]
MKILITGGTGYIASHTCVELLNKDYNLILIDNFCNSNNLILDKIKKITNKNFKFYKTNLCNKRNLNKIFDENDIDIVIHFASLKSVGESVVNPLTYYRNNIDSTLTLLEVMKKHNCKKLIFSSSATVYAPSKIQPLLESSPLGASNPYGATKIAIENLLNDIYISDSSWSIAILRYFNPAGAHKSGLLGEEYKNSNSLFSSISKVINDKEKEVFIMGNDYDTYDKTAIRDYIHVVDLAKAHLKVINRVKKYNEIDIYNIGTGRGYSVLEILNTFMNTNNIKIKYKFTKRREGDLPMYFCNPKYIYNKLNWKSKLTIEDMCKDTYNYIIKNKSKEEK